MISFIKLNEKLDDAITQLQSYQPDIILVSCYARLIPQSILSLAKIGCFNLHPSLLPRFRGPTPLFWQFRAGESYFGVTLHRMSSEFDRGNILGQKRVKMHDGINKKEATTLLANAGSSLILEVLDNISKNHLYETAQENSLSSYQSYPAENDFSVSDSWTAKRIFNFIKAFTCLGVSFLYDVDGFNFKLTDALSYQDEPYNNMLDKKFVIEGNLITFACLNGYIKCQFKMD